MRLKVLILGFALLCLLITVRAQTTEIVPIVYNSGTNADSIQVQVADNVGFTINVISPGWKATTPNKVDTTNFSFPSDIASKIYYHRGRTKNIKTTSVWSTPWSFTLNITQPPGGCTPISPANGAVIQK